MSAPYLKMRVPGAIEFAPGNSVATRIKHVALTPFPGVDGAHRQFTWRTIQTWYSRYKKNGSTTMQPKPRGDKGSFRKVEPEKLQEVIEKVLPAFRADRRRLTVALVCHAFLVAELALSFSPSASWTCPHCTVAYAA